MDKLKLIQIIIALVFMFQGCQNQVQEKGKPEPERDCLTTFNDFIFKNHTEQTIGYLLDNECFKHDLASITIIKEFSEEIYWGFVEDSSMGASNNRNMVAVEFEGEDVYIDGMKVKISDKLDDVFTKALFSSTSEDSSLVFNEIEKDGRVYFQVKKGVFIFMKNNKDGIESRKRLLDLKKIVQDIGRSYGKRHDEISKIYKGSSFKDFGFDDKVFVFEIAPVLISIKTMDNNIKSN